LSLVALLMASTLIDFDDAADVALWRAVDDIVMGGVSRSTFRQAQPGVASFSGNVSLENFGGFASVRTPPRDWDTAGATAFLLRVRGDGHAYKFTIRTGDGFDGIQYQARFTVARSGEGACTRPDDQRQAGGIVRTARRLDRDRTLKIRRSHWTRWKVLLHCARALDQWLRDRSAAPTLIT
jgi:hypothetical protein